MVVPYRWVIPLPVPRVLEVECNRSSFPFSSYSDLHPFGSRRRFPLWKFPHFWVPPPPSLGRWRSDTKHRCVRNKSQHLRKKNQKKQVVCSLSFPSWWVVPTCLPYYCWVTQPQKSQKTFPLDPRCPYTWVQLQPRNSKQA